MRHEIRQKAMVGLVAAVSLGAGSYYFLGRDSGDFDPASFTSAGVERRAAATPVSLEPKRKVQSPKPEPEARPIERQERDETPDDPGRRDRKRQDRHEKKKPLDRAS